MSGTEACRLRADRSTGVGERRRRAYARAMLRGTTRLALVRHAPRARAAALQHVYAGRPTTGDTATHRVGHRRRHDSPDGRPPHPARADRRAGARRGRVLRGGGSGRARAARPSRLTGTPRSGPRARRPRPLRTRAALRLRRRREPEPAARSRRRSGCLVLRRRHGPVRIRRCSPRRSGRERTDAASGARARERTSTRTKGSTPTRPSTVLDTTGCCPLR